MAAAIPGTSLKSLSCFPLSVRSPRASFPIFFPEMTPLEHIGMALRLYEKDGPGAEDRVLELLRGFDLMPMANTPIPALSRGQAYKVALTALIAANPELWLLDEPMASGMDALGLREFRERREARQAVVPAQRRSAQESHGAAPSPSRDRAPQDLYLP